MCFTHKYILSVCFTAAWPAWPPWTVPPGPAEMLLYCSPLASEYFMNGVEKWMPLKRLQEIGFVVCVCACTCVYVTWEIGTQNMKVTKSNNRSYWFQLSLCLFNWEKLHPSQWKVKCLGSCLRFEYAYIIWSCDRSFFLICFSLYLYKVWYITNDYRMTTTNH